MQKSFSQERQVEFSETDMAGIVHFSNYFKWMEAAELAMLESVGIPVVNRKDDRFNGWPRVQVSAKYKLPLRYRDRIRIDISVKEFRIRSIQYVWTVRKLTEEGDLLAARGDLVAVWVELDPLSGEIVSVPMPEAFAEKLQPYTVG